MAVEQRANIKIYLKLGKKTADTHFQTPFSLIFPTTIALILIYLKHKLSHQIHWGTGMVG
jgi:hypothetical protein